MQKPDVILDNLTKHSTDHDYKYKKLYRYLYNSEFYLKAYSKIYAKEGNMTPGVDGKTIDGFSMEKVEKLIETLKDFSYKPNPSRRVYIEKKNSDTKRPLGVPSFEDKLVQEILRAILEAIYEPTFSNSSHAYRPKRNCHTALGQLKLEGTGTRWWVEGDIKGFFNNIDHHVLISILRRRITDEKFINLVWKFLKAGYCEDWTFRNTYSGTPQGGILSPILSNIYLNELDAFMEKTIAQFDKGKSRKINKEYKLHSGYIYKLKDRLKPIWNNLDMEKKGDYLKKIQARRVKTRSLPSGDPFDQNFKRMKYIRYADDLIVGIQGSKEDAIEIKCRIKEFLSKKLKLELSDEKTLITRAMDKARFLGYDIYVSNRTNVEKMKNRWTKDKMVNGELVKGKLIKGQWVEKTKGKVMLSVPFDKMRDFLLSKEAMVIDKEGNWKSTHRKYLLKLDDLEIISTYNSEIRGFYEYYKYAHNVYKLNGMYNIMKYSWLKTLASKYRTKGVSHLLKKYNYKQGKAYGVFFETAKGTKFRTFHQDNFNRVSTFPSYKDIWVNNPDIHPHTVIYSSRNSLEKRILANTCEWCGIDEGQMEVHHVRKLKDLKGKKKWEQLMISRMRKTLVMCVSCHDLLHAGKLN